VKILVYGINYYPELIGIGKYSSEMCEWFADQGHEVEVITAMPSYPHWKVNDLYSGKWWHTEIINKVKIHRCPLYVPSKVTGKTRILHELSFAISSLVYWIPCLFKRYNVVICIAPPLQVGLAGVIYAAFCKTLFVYHIQDIQLDAAKQLGLIRNQTMLSFASRFEKFLLKKSHVVSTISEGMANKIKAKGVPAEKIIYLKNWTDTNRMVPQEPDEQLRLMFGIDSSKKIILYSGNIGEKQGIEIIIDVAESLKNSNFVFLIIGAGAFKERFEKIVLTKSLNNVKVFPLQPLDMLNKLLSIADIHLVLQKKSASDLVMPSKFSNILSVGGVAIVTTEKGTTLYEIIEKNKIAIIAEPESPVALRNSIVSNINSDLSEYKRNARLYAIEHLEKSIIMKNFQHFLTGNSN
jgi:colanic acid biosynthesis glycosyl transferase WcaI